MSDEERPQPFDPDLAAMVLGAIRARARLVAVLMALSVGTFVYLVADAGRPIWLVALIGIFGVVLIAFFIALVWFWLRFFSHSGRKG